MGPGGYAWPWAWAARQVPADGGGEPGLDGGGAAHPPAPAEERERAGEHGAADEDARGHRLVTVDEPAELDEREPGAEAEPQRPRPAAQAASPAPAKSLLR
jgi:hypothetical protein